MKIKNLRKTFYLLPFALAKPKLILAQVTNPALGSNLQTTNGTTFFSRLIPALVTLLFVIGSVVFIFILLTGAIQWISSGGDKAQTEAARSRITNALIGLLILFSVFAIINLVEIFFGIDITYFNFRDFSLGQETPVGPPGGPEHEPF